MIYSLFFDILSLFGILLNLIIIMKISKIVINTKGKLIFQGRRLTWHNSLARCSLKARIGLQVCVCVCVCVC